MRCRSCSAPLFRFLISVFGLGCALGANSGLAHAEETFQQRQDRPLWLYAAIEGGYLNSSGNEFQKSPDGAVFALGGVLSYKIPRWVFDGGIFWQTSSISGTLPGGQPVNIQTKSAMAELSPRYRLTPNWELGVVVDGLFGTNTNFSYNNDDANSAIFAGLKAAYEIPTDSVDIRLTLSAAPDLTATNRTVWMILAGIQVGIPLSGPAAPPEPYHPRPTPTPVPEQPVIHQKRAIVPPVSDLNKPPRELRVALPRKVVYFKTKSSTLTARAKDILNKIGVFISTHNALWNSLEISGHADSRGSYKYNLKLSGLRADSVIAELAKGGALRSKMKMEAFSYTRPAVSGQNQAAWAKNRRVELVFKGVDNPALMETEIKSIIKTAVPDKSERED